MKGSVIDTGNLILRPARGEDAAPLFEVYGDPLAMRYWDRLPHADVAETEKLVAGIMAMAPPPRYLVVEHQGRAVGTAGFWRESEVGYILHPRLWGQGLGGELLRALIRYGFDRLGFDAITAETDPDNAISNHMLARAGFRETGRAENTLQLGDRWVGSVYFELRRGDENGPPG